MGTIRIVPLQMADADRFYTLAAEYLPDSDPERMRRFAAIYPEAYRILRLNGRIIGVCYGWFRRHFVPDDPSFTLDGICIEYDHWRKGYGRQLLRTFEDAAAPMAHPAFPSAPAWTQKRSTLPAGIPRRSTRCGRRIAP